MYYTSLYFTPFFFVLYSGVILFTMTCGYLPFHIESLKKPTNYDAVLKYPVSVSIRKYFIKKLVWIPV